MSAASTLLIRLPQDGLRQWLAVLWPRAASLGFDVSVQVVGSNANSEPRGATFELGHTVSRFSLGLPIEPSSATYRSPTQRSRWDWIIDLTSGGSDTPIAHRHVHVKFDGGLGHQSVLQALTEGRLPTITLSDAGTKRTLAWARPAAEDASSLSEAAGCVYARLISLIVRQLQAPDRRNAGDIEETVFETEDANIVGRLDYQMSLQSVLRPVYRSLCFFPQWRCGFRFAPTSGVIDSRSLGGTQWRNIPQPHGHFYADPFPAEIDGRFYVFFEDFIHKENKAVISAVEVSRDGAVGPAREIIREEWHLSYPLVFNEAGDWWIIPESHQSNGLHLYRSGQSPYMWSKAATILSDTALADATLLKHNGKYWLFATPDDGYGSICDLLDIYHSTSLIGPWIPHARNPVIIDGAGARSAGNIIFFNNHMLRPAQICSTGYGGGIAFFQIDRLDENQYEQRLVFALKPDMHWPGQKLHTYNRAGPLECIDGQAVGFRVRRLARAAEQLIRSDNGLVVKFPRAGL